MVFVSNKSMDGVIISLIIVTLLIIVHFQHVQDSM